MMEGGGGVRGWPVREGHGDGLGAEGRCGGGGGGGGVRRTSHHGWLLRVAELLSEVGLASVEGVPTASAPNEGVRRGVVSSDDDDDDEGGG